MATLTPEQRAADRAIIDEALHVTPTGEVACFFAGIALLRWPAALDALDEAERDNARLRAWLERIVGVPEQMRKLRELTAIGATVAVPDVDEMARDALAGKECPP